MNTATQSVQFQGPAGVLEGLQDEPVAGAFKGIAVIAHPHPLFGGTMQNKVVQTLAKAFVQNGWRAIRFNFRGVGASAGVYDEGRGELDDMLSVIAQSQAQAPGSESMGLALAGFSFGAYVTSHAAAQNWCWSAQRLRGFRWPQFKRRCTTKPWWFMVRLTTPCLWPA
jgi:alpha/beta superfamily hydrolase